MMKTQYQPFFVSLKIALTIGFLSVLNGCSVNSPLEPNCQHQAKLIGLHGKTEFNGRIPVVHVNEQRILGKQLFLESGYQKIEVKFYQESAKPIYLDLSFQSKVGHCYQLEYANQSYRIKHLGRCKACQ